MVCARQSATVPCQRLLCLAVAYQGPSVARRAQQGYHGGDGKRWRRRLHQLVSRDELPAVEKGTGPREEGADEAEATPVVAREAALGARASLLWLQEPASFDIRPPCLLVAGNAEPACFRSPTTPERLSPVRSCSLPRFLREYRQDAEIGGHKWSRGWIFIASLDNDRGIALPWWR
ncbi:hypothetical protein ACCO45_004790 [Purpureocillium lilacinum]|uniref:Uncharacterized protein n=1 Tax=Purpureocillium lilacinum TaxID=33203 RepID=A0ACC4DUF7_PURLI